MNSFAAEGYSASQLLTQLHERVVFTDDLTARQKSVISEKIAVIYNNIPPYLTQLIHNSFFKGFVNIV